MEEIWRPVVGWEAFYEVSSLGRIKRREGEQCRIPGGRIMTLTPDHRGYLVVSLVSRNRKERPYVHAVVCEAFHGPRPLGMHCCHGPAGKADNSAANLRWDTPTANKWDQDRDGTIPCVEMHGRAKLKNEDVEKIVTELANGRTSTSLAREYGVSAGAIAHIKHGRQWTRVTQSQGASKPC